MTADNARGLPLLAAAVALLLSSASAGAQEDPRFVTEQADGVVDSAEFTRLSVLGIAGAVSVRAGRPGDLRYMCRDLSTRREARAVALWVGERELILGPAQGAEAERNLCEVVVPPNFTSILVEMTDGKVVLNGLHGRSEVSGNQVELDVRALAGSLDASIEGGSVRVTGAADSVDVDGRHLRVAVQDVKGAVSLTLRESRADLGRVGGDVVLDLEETDVAAEAVDGRFEASSTSGTVVLSGLRGGGELHLSFAPLTLAASQGPFEVDTDGAVDARDLVGDLRLHGEGGRLSTIGSSGHLVVDAVACEVIAEKISGTTRVEGDTLDVRLRELSGDLEVRTTSSRVAAAGIAGSVVVENDFGDVLVAQTQKPVSITTLQGNVQATQLSGPLQLRAEGPDVTVHWAANPGEDSYVENGGGNVTVMFSGESGGRVEAQSRRGQVESDVAGVEVGDSGSSAKGIVNRMSQPTIQIVADGNLTLRAGSPGGTPARSGQ